MLIFVVSILFIIGIVLNMIYDDNDKDSMKITRMTVVTLVIKRLVGMYGGNLNDFEKALIYLSYVYIRFIVMFIRRVYKRYKTNRASGDVS